jgi:hypothetical protein
MTLIIGSLILSRGAADCSITRYQTGFIPSSGETLPALVGGPCSVYLHFLNEIASSSAPPYKVGYYKIHTLRLIVLQYLLPPFLRAFYALIHMNTIRKYLD